MSLHNKTSELHNEIREFYNKISNFYNKINELNSLISHHFLSLISDSFLAKKIQLFRAVAQIPNTQ